MTNIKEKSKKADQIYRETMTKLTDVKKRQTTLFATIRQKTDNKKIEIIKKEINSL